MKTRPRKFLSLRLVLIGLFLSCLASCSQQSEPLVIYAGKGLKQAMEELKQSFEQQDGRSVSIIYAGSDTLLTTLKNTQKGDVFIPGSLSYIKRAGGLVTNHRFVAHHIPAFAVHANTSTNLSSYADLLVPGVRIAVGNKNMCAIGRVGEAILNDCESHKSFRHNIVVTGSTVNELIQLLINQEVDAALIWKDMLEWPEAKNLQYIALPEDVNKTKEIWVAELATSTDPKRAKRFADFVATEGQRIFIKHGFGKD